MAAQIGVYGLGTMGSALALNMAEKGYDVAVSNRETEWIAPFLKEAEDLPGVVEGHADLTAFVGALRCPRVHDPIGGTDGPDDRGDRPATVDRGYGYRRW